MAGQNLAQAIRRMQLLLHGEMAWAVAMQHARLTQDEGTYG